MSGLKILHEDSLAIDPQQLCSDIEYFIRTKFVESRKEGILVTVSGGLDSRVAASLVTRAVGKDKVIALMLPVRFGEYPELPNKRAIRLFPKKEFNKETDRWRNVYLYSDKESFDNPQAPMKVEIHKTEDGNYQLLVTVKPR